MIHFTWLFTYTHLAQNGMVFKISKRPQRNWTFFFFFLLFYKCQSISDPTSLLLFISCCGSRHCHFGSGVYALCMLVLFFFFSYMFRMTAATNRHCHLLTMRVNNALYAGRSMIFTFSH